MKTHVRSAMLLFALALVLRCGEWKLLPAARESVADVDPVHCVTNVSQFSGLSGEDFLAGCAFRLNGVVTLVDTNRKFLVLQDATGAVGLNSQLEGLHLQVGELVTLQASSCAPLLLKFPDYPYRPAGWEIRDSFEAPVNWGQYNLTRMRGYLHPQVSGSYTFWIASDNSSELWLSLDAAPSKTRKIASMARFDWTLAREWSKFPSQRSEPISLKAGQTYYIEALQEQTGGGENLAVAWEGPGVKQAVIPAAYLTPWDNGHEAVAGSPTNGILREYWTNYSAGDLLGVTGARPFESALTVEGLHVIARGAGQLPKPNPIAAIHQWSAANNYRWAEAEGVVKFVGEEGISAFVELGGHRALLQVRALCPNAALSRVTRNAPVRITGVCEEIYDETGTPVPGLIWLTTEDGISNVELPTTAPVPSVVEQSLQAKPNPAAAPMSGFYGTRGVVTFNARVFDKDCLFVQEGNAAMFVSLENFNFQSPLRVGQLVDLGGSLQPGKFLPIITPLVLTEVGQRALPAPVTEPIQFPIPGTRDGKWTEIQGVVHSVNSNGTLSVMGPSECLSIWLGNTASNELSRFVDAKLRALGVLSLSTFDFPVLLVPSRSFVQLDEEPPPKPFAAPVHSIADLKRAATELSLPHRTKVAGEVTLREPEWFVIQDSTGGIRVQTLTQTEVKIGQALEVLGFPTMRGAERILSDAVVRATSESCRVEPSQLDLSEGLPVRQNGNLIRIQANLLGARTIGNSQILELQNGRRFFTATLATAHGRLMDIVPGSEVEAIGVCDAESAMLPIRTSAKEKAAFASLNIWLRSPQDLRVLEGPAWWTWKRAALLIGTLFTASMMALLWVQLLRRRLERQKAVQLAFSEQVLKRLEDERHRIAANLHDGLGQVLLAIKNQSLLALQRNGEDGNLRQRLDAISSASSQSLEEVRQIIYGLRPYQLDRLGLTQAIRATVSRVSSNSQIVFAVRVEDVDRIFDKDSEIHLYRIVQEALNNVIKHSGATEAAVVIKNRPNIISLSIRDNGRGFDANSASGSEPHDIGYGLSGIAERVRILRGTLSVDSRPGEGASLNIEIPVRKL